MVRGRRSWYPRVTIGSCAKMCCLCKCSDHRHHKGVRRRKKSYDSVLSSCRLVTTFALLSLKSQQFAHFYKITIFSIQTHTSFQSFHRHERSRRLQRATNLTSFSRAHDMCGHVRAASARRKCAKCGNVPNAEVGLAL